MSKWRLAKSIERIRYEIDRGYPKRDKASDGTIGDAAHSARNSDHNPNAAGVVRAIDIDSGPGIMIDRVVSRLVRDARAGHPAFGNGAYIIWNRRIISATYGWDKWRKYDGVDPHTSHVHVSVATTAKGYDSTRHFGLYGDAKKAKAKCRECFS